MAVITTPAEIKPLQVDTNDDVITTAAEIKPLQEDNDDVIPTAAEIKPLQEDMSCARGMCLLFLPHILIVAVVTITVLLFRLNPPTRLDPKFRVHSAALQYPHINATCSSSKLTATWDMTLIATNPNMKWDIYCDSLNTLLFYGFGYDTKFVAATSLCPLFLKSSNQTSVSFKIPTFSVFVADDVAKEISDGNNTALSLRFGLRILVQYSYRAHLSNVKTPEPFFVQYYCYRIPVQVFSNDTNNNNNNSHINEAGSLNVTTDHQATECYEILYRF